MKYIVLAFLLSSCATYPCLEHKAAKCCMVDGLEKCERAEAVK